jgi:hypothetical protein
MRQKSPSVISDEVEDVLPRPNVPVHIDPDVLSIQRCQSLLGTSPAVEHLATEIDGRGIVDVEKTANITEHRLGVCDLILKPDDLDPRFAEILSIGVEHFPITA